jgi:hypothetical protein
MADGNGDMKFRQSRACLRYYLKQKSIENKHMK